MERETSAMTGKGAPRLMAQRGHTGLRTEPWDRVTVVMLERHVGYLDLMSLLIRLRHHRPVSRTTIVQALVEFMERSDIDFTQFASIEAMVAYLAAHFSRNPSRGQWPLRLESSLFQPRRAEPPPQNRGETEMAAGP